jgi:hypothetical protein
MGWMALSAPFSVIAISGLPINYRKNTVANKITISSDYRQPEQHSLKIINSYQIPDI